MTPASSCLPCVQAIARGLHGRTLAHAMCTSPQVKSHTPRTSTDRAQPHSSLARAVVCVAQSSDAVSWTAEPCMSSFRPTAPLHGHAQVLLPKRYRYDGDGMFHVVAGQDYAAGTQVCFAG